MDRRFALHRSESLAAANAPRRIAEKRERTTATAIAIAAIN